MRSWTMWCHQSKYHMEWLISMLEVMGVLYIWCLTELLYAFMDYVVPPVQIEGRVYNST